MKTKKFPFKQPAWFDHRFTLILGVVILMLAAGAAWNRPLPPISAPELKLEGAALPQVEETPSAAETPLQPSRTPYPPELLANRQQTIGISLVAAILVLIVAGGVFSVFLRDRDSS